MTATASEAVVHEFPLPTILTNPASTPPTLITQGAEGRLYKTTYLLPSIPCALKYRPPKPWRHPILDQRLTKHRILSEARILSKCRRDGLRVPDVYALDEAAGWLMLEWVQGTPVRININQRLGDRTEGIEADEELKDLMRRIGAAVGKMHSIGIIHGDLTTSNMMLNPPSGPDRNRQRVHDEDRAVDLYVLERAFGSTHPRAECIFGEVLDAYKQSFKQAGVALKKLEEVRMRGRKRSMLG
ncbi:serine/threonine-protein kinase bud32 [Trichoderma virens]|nr:serine/threonine-protein kinase bud32 [Trichoderma virens]